MEQSQQHVPDGAREVQTEPQAQETPGLLSTLGGLGILLILITVIFDVGARQFLGSGILAADAMISNWWMVAVAMLGIVAAERSGAQIVVDIAGEGVSTRAQRWVTIFSGAVVAAFGLTVAVVSLFEAIAQMQAGEYAAVGSLLIWPARFLIPLGFGGLAFFATRDVIRTIRTQEGVGS